MFARSTRRSLEIANRILDIAKSKKINLTMMQLQKLVYFAHGWHLAFFEKPLVSDSPEVWRYGPVFFAIYEEFKASRAKPIGEYRAAVKARKFTPEIEELLEGVVESYGEIDAWELSMMTHEKGSPWDKTMIAGGFFKEIPNEVIKQYFVLEKESVG